MTEDELLAGITEALGWGGWTWMHILRSDGVTMGLPGLPDIIAAHRQRGIVLAWELKSHLSTEQIAWMLALENVCGVDYRIIRPEDYDRALDVIVKHYDPIEVWPAA